LTLKLYSSPFLLCLKTTNSKEFWNGNNEKVGFKYLFPNKTEVFSDWVSGDIRIPEGDLLQKINIGYASVFARDRLLNFD